MARERHHNALPSGYKLHWYVIGSVIGKGGFGITYLALDTNLDQRVAIKEFLPVELATRGNNSRVHPISEDHSDTYGWGLNRFVTEARTLAKFRHPNVVRVMSVFEANSTAYMVMEYERGESLEKLLKAKKMAGEAKLRAILMPLLDGLKVVHEAGFIHRDIKPDNIFLRENGAPVLLDFGSARQAIGVATRTLTALVTPGYAPFEQYDTTEAGEKKQGPWTDIYSLGATLYRAVTGIGPPDAMARITAIISGTDILKPASEAAKGDFSPAFLSAIDWALEFLPENRPQSVDEWRTVLQGRGTRPAPTRVANLTTDFARAAPTERRTEARTQVRGSGTGNGATPPPATTRGPHPGADSRRGGASPQASARAAATDARAGAPGMVATDRIAPPARRGAEQTPGRRSGPGIGRRIAEFTAVVLILGAMGAWYYLTQPQQSPAARKPVASIDTGGEPSGAESATASLLAEQQARLDAQRAREQAAQEEALATARAEAEKARKRAEVERLLREATQDLAADRLTTPADSNAFVRYRAVLALEPANEEALEGLHNILTRYLALAKAASGENNFDLARRYLDKAGAVSPGAESIAAARTAVDERMKAREEERQRIESEARKAAEEERLAMEAARRATEEERRRLEAARLAAERERQRIKAEREAEIERQRLEQEAILQAKLDDDFKKAKQIAELLAGAEEALEAGRLTSPVEDNALARFEAVLAIDAQNQEADAGIRRIAERHVELAEKQIAAYRFDEAEALIDEANTIYAGIPSIATARQRVRDGRAAYDGRRPIVAPPYRLTLPPVIGANDCAIDDPMPEIERAGTGFLRGDRDLAFVPTAATVGDSWQDAGINMEPRVERLYLLGRKEKLDGALLFWFSAVGTQCINVHVDAYLVDLQTRTVYADKGTKADLQDMTGELLSQFKSGRRALARSQ
ncbi:MAG: protein kinase [Gammaproteobacteria bacterium]|nr:protein kinase [Gammaproteobacteria bacterium]NIM72108.1 protein kinase [Gammaproteobacteria bacterium]NIN38389.1 protein kinase [Gammaproteobacteria bacterium]NIO23835.1 protein kinase [Gammaproteobacteria bacterium]NIO64477.1 protein kinase [Gammaproteobacteria bacterium]